MYIIILLSIATLNRLPRMNASAYLGVLAFFCHCALITCYINVRLEDKLCAVDVEDPGITLLENSDSAAIFTQQWNSTVFDVNFPNKIRHHCVIKMLNSQDAYRIPKGTYAVITHLNFRRDSETNECLDYIQFKSGSDAPTKRICGNIILDGPSNPDLMLDNRFQDINITIHIDNSRKIMEPLELRMVLTAHTQCTHKDDFLCDLKQPYSCISRHFVGDNVTNCITPCRDEPLCFQETIGSLRDFVKNSLKNEIVSEIEEANVNNLRFATDDSTNCITVQLLEEKLKENNELLRDYMEENKDSLLSQIDVRIADKATSGGVPLYDNDEEEYEDKCITRELFEMKLKENSELIIGAIRESENRLSNRIDQMMSEYKKDLFQLRDRIEQLEKSLKQPTPLGGN